MPDCCSVAPHHLALQGASPQGEALERGRNLNRPLLSAYADTFPATVGFFALFSLRRKSEKGESKDKATDARHFSRRGKQERGLNIKRLFGNNAGLLFDCPSSPCFARSFPPRGSLEKMKKFESASIVCLRRHFSQRGKQERGLSIRRLFEEKMPECCSVAPHSSKASLCPPSPRGEGLT